MRCTSVGFPSRGGHAKSGQLGAEKVGETTSANPEVMCRRPSGRKDDARNGKAPSFLRKVETNKGMA